jgi:hypothetical protein
VARPEEQQVFDSATDTALLVAVAMPLAVVTLYTWSYWPLAAGVLPLGVAVLRRRPLAFVVVSALLATCALLVSISRSLS